MAEDHCCWHENFFYKEVSAMIGDTYSLVKCIYRERWEGRKHQQPNTNTANNDTFETNLNTLLGSLSSKAASTTFYNETSNQIYALFLCRGDIVSNTDCQNCCQGKKGWRILTPTCNVRYEEYTFFQLPVPPPVPTAQPVPDNGGNGGKNTTKIVIITVSTFAVVAALLGFCFYSFFCRKSRKGGAAHLGSTQTVEATLSGFTFGLPVPEGTARLMFNLFGSSLWMMPLSKYCRADNTYWKHFSDRSEKVHHTYQCDEQEFRLN